jgi:hypothetical protein
MNGVAMPSTSPGSSQRDASDVHAPGHGAFGRGRRGTDGCDAHGDGQEKDGAERWEWPHGLPSSGGYWGHSFSQASATRIDSVALTAIRPGA